jgi:hypothetical protein
MMHSISIFTSAFFFCVATAVASQPGKVKLHGVPRNALTFRAVQKGKGDQPNPKGLVSLVQPTQDFHFALKVGQPTHAKDFHVALKVGASTLHFNGTSLKTENITVKKVADGSDRRLGQAGSIRGGNMKDSIQREQSLQGFKKNNAFAAAVVMPIPLQGMLMKTSGGSSRRLQDTMECSENSDGSLTCRADGDGFKIKFRCPKDAETSTDCHTCVLTLDNADDQCKSCTVCSASDSSGFAYDCSGVAPDEVCAISDCDGDCKDSSSTPTDSTPTDDHPTVSMECSDMGDGKEKCRREDFPTEGLDIELTCPSSGDDELWWYECYTCVISTDDNADQCTSCTICSASDTAGFAFDCSNVAEGDWECPSQDCDAKCLGSPPTPTDSTPTDSTPTDPTPTNPTPTDPTPTPTNPTPTDPMPTNPTPTDPPPTGLAPSAPSPTATPTTPNSTEVPRNETPWVPPTGSASVTETGMLFSSATAIAAFSLF